MFSMVSSYLSIAGQAFKCGQTLFFRMKSNPKSYVNVIRTINSCAVQARGMVFLKCVCGGGGGGLIQTYIKKGIQKNSSYRNYDSEEKRF